MRELSGLACWPQLCQICNGAVRTSSSSLGQTKERSDGSLVSCKGGLVVRMSRDECTCDGLIEHHPIL